MINDNFSFTSDYFVQGPVFTCTQYFHKSWISTLKIVFQLFVSHVQHLYNWKQKHQYEFLARLMITQIFSVTSKINLWRFFHNIVASWMLFCIRLKMQWQTNSCEFCVCKNIFASTFKNRKNLLMSDLKVMIFCSIR